MRSIRRSNSSKNELQPEYFAQRTGWLLPRRPALPPDGTELTFASSIRSRTEFATDIVPSDRLNQTRIEITNPERDLGPPGLFGLFIDLCVKAIDERVGKCRSRCGGQPQGLCQQFRWIFSHRSYLTVCGPHAGSMNVRLVGRHSATCTRQGWSQPD